MNNLKETREMLSFIFKLIEAIKESGQDGKITVADVPNFFGALVAAPSAITGANLILNELTTATEIEKQALFDWVAKEFSINNDKIEMYIETIFVHVIGIVTSSIIAFRKSEAETA